MLECCGAVQQLVCTLLSPSINFNNCVYCLLRIVPYIHGNWDYFNIEIWCLQMILQCTTSTSQSDVLRFAGVCIELNLIADSDQLA